jgi:hypothetical protein
LTRRAAIVVPAAAPRSRPVRLSLRRSGKSPPPVLQAGTVITREQLLSDVWDANYYGSTKTLDMHISALLRKLGDSAITTIRGLGYRLEPEP